MQHPRDSIQPSTTDSAPATFLRMPMIVFRIGLCRSTIYKLIAEQKFPRPVRVGDRAVAWRRADIDRWIEERPPASH